MPSSWSSSLRFELQFTGENINLWGDKLNVDLQHVDYAIAGWLNRPLTGDYTLTTANAGDDEARAAMIKFTGTGPFTVTIPSVSKRYFFWNACSAAVTITTGAGTTVILDPGAKVNVACDGSNVVQPGYAGYGLKDYIDQAVLATTGSLPATTGNNGKVLACVLGAWTPTLLDSSYISSFSANSAAVRTGTTTASAVTPGDLYNALAEVTLTDATTIAVDMATFINAAVTLGGNRTLGNPTNVKAGQRGRIRFIQDGTGSRTITFSSNWKRAGGAAVLTTTAAAIDVLEYDAVSSTYILYDVLKNPS